MKTPADIQLVGTELAIRWDDGSESYLPFERLRAKSPSAETRGERDILGNQHGGHAPRAFPGVTVIRWEKVGNYALRFDFSDGHRTGIFSYEYLLEIENDSQQP
ncbi:gamma-butyrobetaine hydroxylase-like domain-containing protein [Nibricoccus sp. IMCC34717]|uniref:gamma-butyrobetaine hydroxylase-like domain-containing protein n=1 Tax=Nibricoccus sp. IMCC34717 TaxID=3034021 RepID=UPI00384F11B7